MEYSTADIVKLSGRKCSTVKAAIYRLKLVEPVGSGYRYRWTEEQKDKIIAEMHEGVGRPSLRKP